MAHKVKAINKFIVCLFTFTSFSLLTNQNFLRSENNFEDKKAFNTEKEFILKSEYILGSGDVIKIDFIGLEMFSKEYKIDNEGFILLPEIRRFKAKGLTLNELEKKLELAFLKFIKNPDIQISISMKRRIKVFISGEVKTPGLYEFEPSLTNKINSDINQGFYLYEAIRQTGGFTNFANLSNIQIIRKNSLTQGGGKISTTLDFLKLFSEGDQSTNIELMDGDYLIISKSKNIIKEQLQAINKTNINNGSIHVYVTGNIPKRGAIKLKTGATLIQAIASAGGTKFWTGNIEYLSFNYDGSSDMRVFKYDKKANINSYKNPTLKDGDVINVKNTALKTTTEVLSEISSPILSGLGLIKIFGD